MTYEEFEQEFMDQLAERASLSDMIGEYRLYHDGETSDEDEVLRFIRDTNIKYSNIESEALIGDFLRIRNKKQTDTLARFEMKYLYESFKESGWDFVWKIIEDNLNFTLTVDPNSILTNLSNFDFAKERLILRPLNYTDNKYALKEHIYKKIGDMALVLYVYISETKEYGLTTSKVPKKIVESWNVDIEEVLQLALINSNVKAVPRMYTGIKEMSNPTYETGAYMAIDSNCKLGTGLITSVFTTYPQPNGSISFWYPGVSEKIAEMAGGDYYVVFTSTFDFRVHPVGSIKPRFLLSSLKDMNRDMNKKEEIMTRKIYMYKADTKELVQLEL